MMPAGYVPYRPLIKSKYKSKRQKKAAKTNATKAYVKKAIAKDHEKGYLDKLTSNIFTEPGSDAVFQVLNLGVDDAITPGLPGAVTGLSYKMTTLEGTVRYVNNGAASVPCRTYMLYDSDTNGSKPTPSDVWTTTTDTGLFIPQLKASKRYSVLYDHAFVLGGNTAATKEKNTKIIRFRNKKINRKVLAFPTGFTTGIESVRKGALLCVTLSTTNIATNTIEASGNLRLHYEM